MSFLQYHLNPWEVHLVHCLMEIAELEEDDKGTSPHSLNEVRTYSP